MVVLVQNTVANLPLYFIIIGNESAGGLMRSGAAKHLRIALRLATLLKLTVQCVKVAAVDQGRRGLIVHLLLREEVSRLRLWLVAVE